MLLSELLLWLLPSRQVIATSRTPYHEVAAEMGVGYFTDANDFCEEHPDVVVLATSILSMDKVGRRVGGCGWTRGVQGGLERV